MALHPLFDADLRYLPGMPPLSGEGEFDARSRRARYQAYLQGAEGRSEAE